MNIKLYNYKLSAGSGVSIFDNQEVETVTVAKRLLESITKINVNNLILLEVEGLSMEPTISDGDTILIDTGANTLDKEGIFAFTWR